MARITALSLGRGRTRKASVSLDGRPAFSLDAEVALQEGLKVGQELSDDRVQELNRTSRQQDCYNAALVYLGYRPRSEHELKQRLYRRGFDAASIRAALARLKEKELVNDAEFARFWRDNRQSFSPRSRWLIRCELQQKQVPDDAIEQAIGDMDDSANAYSVAQAKARRLNDCDYQTFRRRLGDHLKRRGFGYGVCIETVERLWRERSLPE